MTTEPETALAEALGEAAYWRAQSRMWERRAKNNRTRPGRIAARLTAIAAELTEMDTEK